MKKHFSVLICVLVLLPIALLSWKSGVTEKTNVNSGKTFTPGQLFEKYVNNVYDASRLEESGLDINVFRKAFTGFINLKATNKLPQNSSVLTVVDLAKSSSEKRMWIIDIASKSLILKTWVAHGHGSGDIMASRFSDKINSFKSSLGFYLTDDVYFGKHGRSLRLDGLDEGFNTNARVREIVVHAANYVGERVVERQGHVGRSQGCPAVSPAVANQVIDAIKDRTVLFINGNSTVYTSKYLDEAIAANFLDSNANLMANL
jgi:hypothetical protein